MRSTHKCKFMEEKSGLEQVTNQLSPGQSNKTKQTVVFKHSKKVSEFNKNNSKKSDKITDSVFPPADVVQKKKLHYFSSREVSEIANSA